LLCVILRGSIISLPLLLGLLLRITVVPAVGRSVIVDVLLLLLTLRILRRVRFADSKQSLEN